MVRTSKGTRFRTRRVFRKHPRKRGMVPLSRILTEYKEGEYVDIVVEPSVHKGMPHRRFHGKVGIIMGKRGRAYLVKVRDHKRYKTLIVFPEHLRKHKF